MFILSLSAALLGLRVVSAMPFRQIEHEVRGTDVTAIALDERNLEYLAYRHDGTLYGRFPVDADEARDLFDYDKRDASTSCVQLTADDVKKLPGWSKILAYADKTFGTGSRNIVTNPPEYADRGARACVDAANAKIVPSGAPTCTTNTGTVQGSVKGTSGTIKLSYQQGFASTSSWTVTNTGEFAIAATVSAKFSLDLLVAKLSVGPEITTTATFKNSRGEGFETKVNNQITQDLTLNNPQGKACTGTFKTKSCNVGGKGSLKTVASGWVWFNYDSRTKENGTGDEHYKWAVQMENVLPNAADRSSQIDITGNMKASVNSDFTGKCQ